MNKKYYLDNIQSLNFTINKPCLIFLRGTLGLGKTTLSKHIINNMLNFKGEITSPTYTYYNKYGDTYHFDLYRLKNYDEFFAIGGEDILDNNNGVIIVEWPEVIEKYYEADIEIILNRTDNENEREIEINYKKK